ncbi:MAG: AAA-like domain-containing protein [Scytonema sp. PMC 1069.18]|nr:AAA-like domain-containing protein [Scytonema sp. PMC 1069.18]MEC4883054.1 AAA-like domain-containing protein [Scytonema sp. PMC 1070.18]
MTNYHYQVGGSLGIHVPSYVFRKADEELYQALQAGEFCYVLNCRQVGKSSIIVRTRHLLKQEGYLCATIDMTLLGSENITPRQWYKGIITELCRGLNLSRNFHLKSWWEQLEDISLLQRLAYFVEDVLFVQFPSQKIIIFVDEVDSILSLNFTVDDFFALIRFCYNQRTINPQYSHITFAIFGVATPSDLITDHVRTPFNIGKGIELSGFKLHEVQPLAKGWQEKFSDWEAIVKEILDWTGGQPFLTHKLCKLIATEDWEVGNEISLSNSQSFVTSLVRSRIIHNWESQDEPQHFRTIRDRILKNEQWAGRMLGIYQQLVQGVEVKADDSREQIELLLSGLVIRQQGILRVTNRIYQEIFNQEWVEKQLQNLRPYSQFVHAWIASKQTDESRLLRGQALKDAQLWAQGKSLTDLDYQFLAASQELDRHQVEQTLEAKRLLEVEARLAEEKRRLIQQKKSAKQQKYLLTLVSITLVLSIVLGIKAFTESQHAQFSEIQALTTSSEALFASNKTLDALIQAIKAKQKLKKLGVANTQIKSQIEKAVQQAAYEVTEYNRLSGHSNVITGLDFSPDGQTIASGSWDKTIKLWKRDGTELNTLKGHNASVYKVKFSPDGQMLASSSADKTVKLWQRDRKNGKFHVLTTLKGHSAEVWGVAFSPDGQMLASSSADKTIKLWQRDRRDRQFHLLTTLTGHSALVYAVSFSPDGQTIASASTDKTVKLWRRDRRDGKFRILKTLKGHSADVGAVVFSPDGQTIVSASADNTIKLWQRDGTFLTTLEDHTAPISSVAFSSDGQILASAGFDNTAKLWQRNSRDGKFHVFTTLKGHDSGIAEIAYAPKANSADNSDYTIATASFDNTVRLWNAQAALFKDIQGHKAGVRSVVFSPNGQIIASASADNTVKLWNHNGNFLKTLKGHNSIVTTVAFSPDGKILATGSGDKTVKLWQSDGTLMTTLEGHEAVVTNVTFSPDGQTIASASKDNTVKIWRRDGTLVTTLEGHTNAVRSVAYSPNGQTIATASADNTVKLWRRDGRNRKFQVFTTLYGHNSWVMGVDFSPNGQMIATASFDDTVKLWKQDGTLLLTLRGESPGFSAVQFSPDGKIIAAGTNKGFIKLWKLNGTELTTLYRHKAMVWGVAFSPDGKTLATASDDQTVILWDLERVPNLDIMSYSCHWVRDYLRKNTQVEEGDRHLCDDILTRKR